MQPRPSSDEALRRLALPPGYRLGEFAIESVLGKGGFGITYLARDTHLGSRVAIKEMLPDGIATRISNSRVVPLTQSQQASFEWALKRFLGEARKVASLNHDNIVHVLRLLRENGTAYMVMEYLEGQSLAQWIQHHPRPTEPQMLALLLPLLDGLDQVHRVGLLHRDIKPENIIVVAKDGRPVLLDFGSAREITGRTISLTCVVSEGYSPFEQYQQNARQGPYTDLYALAAMAARAMTGQDLPSAPDRTTDPGIPLAQRLRGRYGETFLRALDAAYAVRAEDRPQTVAEFRAMLGGAASARSQASLTARQGMHPLLLTALIGLVAVGAGGGVFFLLGGRSDFAFSGTSVAASSSPSAAMTATRSSPFVNSLGMSFVPAGSPGVLFCTTETTVGQFSGFPKSDACKAGVLSVQNGVAGSFGHWWRKPGFPQTDDHPVVGISLNDARVFCEWLTSSEQAGGRIKPGWRYRLPTDFEWSRAAGCSGETGATPQEKSLNSQRLYEWGSIFPPPEGTCNILGLHHGTTKVGCFSKPNTHGLHDMTGNAAELCDESFCPTDPQLNQLRVLRGAGWSTIGSDEQPYRLTEREHVDPALRNTYHGFRTVLDIR